MVISLRCLLVGHDDRVARSPARLWLQCDHCGRETVGWELRRDKRSAPDDFRSTAVPPSWRRQAAEG
jgi:hypothetical protein